MTEDEREKAIRSAGLRTQSYAYENKGEEKAPAYDRVMKGLRDREVVEEIEAGRGEPGFQEALMAEARRRGLEVKV
jgi:hypothetical protein